MKNLNQINTYKKCSKCKDQKPADQFNKGDCSCRSCKRLQRKTVKGLISNMYSSQCRSIGENNVHYSKQELFDYINQQDQFHALYANWKKSGYLPALTPTCRRHDTDKNFSFDNIYIIVNKSKVDKSIDKGLLRTIGAFMKNLLGGKE